MPLAPWLLSAAVVLLLVEVLQRRTGVLSVLPRIRLRLPVLRRVAGRVPRFAKRVPSVAKGRPDVTSGFAARSNHVPQDGKDVVAAPPTSHTAAPVPAKPAPLPSTQPPPAGGKGIVDALTQARTQAQDRTVR